MEQTLVELLKRVRSDIDKTIDIDREIDFENDVREDLANPKDMEKYIKDLEKLLGTSIELVQAITKIVKKLKSNDIEDYLKNDRCNN